MERSYEAVKQFMERYMYCRVKGYPGTVNSMGDDHTTSDYLLLEGVGQVKLIS